MSSKCSSQSLKTQDQNSSRGSAMMSNAASAFLQVSYAVFVLLALGWCLALGSLPLIVVVLVVHDVSYFPIYLIAGVFSIPALAACFAVCRDQPTLFSPAAAHRAQLVHYEQQHDDFPPAWIAPPYVHDTHEVAVFRPFFKAYRKLFLKSLILGATGGILLYIILLDMNFLAQWQYGALVTPALGIIGVLIAAAVCIALVLIVEYPQAKLPIVMRNALWLSVRRIVMIPVSIVAVGTYIWAFFSSPILTLLLATGIICYLVWASARWQAQLLMVQMARESKDPRIIALYDAHSSRTESSMHAQADWQQ